MRSHRIEQDKVGTPASAASVEGSGKRQHILSGEVMQRCVKTSQFKKKKKFGEKGKEKKVSYQERVGAREELLGKMWT